MKPFLTVGMLALGMLAVASVGVAPSYNRECAGTYDQACYKCEGGGRNADGSWNCASKRDCLVYGGQWLWALDCHNAY